MEILFCFVLFIFLDSSNVWDILLIHIGTYYSITIMLLGLVYDPTSWHCIKTNLHVCVCWLMILLSLPPRCPSVAECREQLVLMRLCLLLGRGHRAVSMTEGEKRKEKKWMDGWIGWLDCKREEVVERKRGRCSEVLKEMCKTAWEEAIIQPFIWVSTLTAMSVLQFVVRVRLCVRMSMALATWDWLMLLAGVFQCMHVCSSSINWRICAWLWLCIWLWCVGRESA